MQEREKVRRLSKGELSMITTLANEIFSIREVLSSSVPCPRCVLAFHVFLAATTCVAGNAVNVLTMPLLEEIM
jgi:hypothetical protein